MIFFVVGGRGEGFVLGILPNLHPVLKMFFKKFNANKNDYITFTKREA